MDPTTPKIVHLSTRKFSVQKRLWIVIVLKLHFCWAWAESILHNTILILFYLNITGKEENAEKLLHFRYTVKNWKVVSPVRTGFLLCGTLRLNSRNWRYFWRTNAEIISLETQYETHSYCKGNRCLARVRCFAGVPKNLRRESLRVTEGLDYWW